jgi:hypothetical protein
MTQTSEAISQGKSFLLLGCLHSNLVTDMKSLADTNVFLILLQICAFFSEKKKCAYLSIYLSIITGKYLYIELII